jgi:hypothetical protein
LRGASAYCRSAPASSGLARSRSWPGRFSDPRFGLSHLPHEGLITTRIPPDFALAVAALAALVALVQSLRLVFRSWLRSRRIALARERGALGEVRAEALLRRLGFSVLGRQVVGRYGLGVDGEALLVELRADYLVEAGGRRFVAEVKTGVFAPRLETAATRRQLLEYRIGFDVDGVLLVDAEAERVRVVDFPLPGSAPAAPGFAVRAFWLVVGIAAGALFTALR